MKNLIVSFLLIVPFLFTSCSDDDDGGTVEITTYTLAEVGDSGVSGTATFTKIDANTTRIDLALTGTPADGNHPAHIHLGSVAQAPGAIAISLTSVDGDTGLSTTTVTALDDDTTINYEGLIDFDGYINVHLSPDDLATLVAQGNIGSNVTN